MLELGVRTVVVSLGLRSAIHFPAVTYCEDEDCTIRVIDSVQNPVVANAKAVLLPTAEFLCAPGSGIVS